MDDSLKEKAGQSRAVGAHFPFGDAKSSPSCTCITICMLNQTCISKPSVRPSLFLGLGPMKKGVISIETVLYRVEVMAWALQRMEQESR